MRFLGRFIAMLFATGTLLALVGVAVGIRREGLTVRSNHPLRLRAVDLLNGREVGVAEPGPGRPAMLRAGLPALLLTT